MCLKSKFLDLTYPAKHPYILLLHYLLPGSAVQPKTHRHPTSQHRHAAGTGVGQVGEQLILEIHVTSDVTYVDRLDDAAGQVLQDSSGVEKMQDFVTADHPGTDHGYIM